MEFHQVIYFHDSISLPCRVAPSARLPDQIDGWAGQFNDQSSVGDYLEIKSAK